MRLGIWREKIYGPIGLVLCMSEDPSRISTLCDAHPFQCFSYAIEH